jgi:DNA-binding CsgD family transcriptional regulator
VDLDLETAAALVAALRTANDFQSTSSVLRAAGVRLPEGEHAKLSNALGGESLLQAHGDETLRGAFALCFLAGRLGRRTGSRMFEDPTTFLMDQDLVIRAAEGESILRLPWFEEELFVGQQLPEIDMIPRRIRLLAVENYRAALCGERRCYAFTSYGHAYSVDAIPVRRPDGRVDSVIAVATPHRSHESAVRWRERTAQRLDRSATLAEQRANRHRDESQLEAAEAETERAELARVAAERARANTQGLRSYDADRVTACCSLTSREVDVLGLASHGLSYIEIADHLVVSPATVKTHFANIYAKLGVTDKAAAVAVALRCGLIE